jgi:23S rRNA (pseudouridine1915-N3)-methyltransferase
LKILVLWFGRPAASPFETQVAEYARRVDRRWQASDQPLRPVSGRDGDARRALAAEAELVRGRVPKGWRMVVLDERGEPHDSAGFARELDEAEHAGVPGLVFVVGSDRGLDGALQAEAWRRLSLSPLTLPHQLARLLLWEQLFRATDILASGRYHRVRVQ